MGRLERGLQAKQGRWLAKARAMPLESEALELAAAWRQAKLSTENSSVDAAQHTPPPALGGIPRLESQGDPETRSGPQTNVGASPRPSRRPQDVLNPVRKGRKGRKNAKGRPGVPLTAPAAIECQDGTIVRIQGAPPGPSAIMSLRQLQERNEAKAALAFETGLAKLIELAETATSEKIQLGAAAELCKMGIRHKKAAPSEPKPKGDDEETVDVDALEAEASTS